MLGGEESNPGQWPWVVDLISVNPCTGAILTPNFILTAANCFGKVYKSYFTFRLKDSNHISRKYFPKEDF